MLIALTHTRKRFLKDWVFRNLNFKLHPEKRYGSTCKNGSGKSALLPYLAGFLSPSADEIHWKLPGKPVEPESLFPGILFAAPYLALTEELTLIETLKFHQRFKPFLPGQVIARLIDISGLQRSRYKPVNHFSQVMRQRLKLLLAK